MSKLLSLCNQTIIITEEYMVTHSSSSRPIFRKRAIGQYQVAIIIFQSNIICNWQYFLECGVLKIQKRGSWRPLKECFSPQIRETDHIFFLKIKMINSITKWAGRQHNGQRPCLSYSLYRFKPGTIGVRKEEFYWHVTNLSCQYCPMV